MTEQETIRIPVPRVAPLGWALNKPELVQEVWDTFVKPDQESGLPPSGEMRMLMAILRSVYQGLSEKDETS